MNFGMDFSIIFRMDFRKLFDTVLHALLHGFRIDLCVYAASFIQFSKSNPCKTLAKIHARTHGQNCAWFKHENGFQNTVRKGSNFGGGGERPHEGHEFGD